MPLSAMLILGQQQVFPARWRGSVVLMVLGLFPLGLLVFWGVRERFGKDSEIGHNKRSLAAAKVQPCGPEGCWSLA
jgi:hypothetical protein